MLDVKSFVQMMSLVKKHEGFRSKAYRCPAGRLTIGYGRNIEDNGISEPEAVFLLRDDLAGCSYQAEGFSWFSVLNAPRQVVIISMLFNLGITRFLGFKKMIGALEQQDYQRAADEMLASQWSTQVGRRSQELAIIMRSGELLI